MEQKGLEPILKLINEELHGWPILNKFTNLQNQTNRSQSTVTEKLVWLAKTDSPQLFDFYVEINPIDPKHNVLMVSVSKEKNRIFAWIKIKSKKIKLNFKFGIRFISHRGFLIQIIYQTRRS